MRHRIIVGVHLVIRDDRGHVLLGLRRGTAFGDGRWHVPAGHLDKDESVHQCAIREAHEELGIVIRPDRLSLLHTLHHRAPDDRHSRMQLFFGVDAHNGQVANREPDRCAELGWWSPSALPPNTMPYTATALAAIAAGTVYAETGWAV